MSRTFLPQSSAPCSFCWGGIRESGRTPRLVIYQQRAEFSHHYANLEGVRIHYVTMGQGAPVVLLHGWPQTWYEWRRVMPLLADKYLLVAPDMRGLGDSSRPSTGYDKKTVANDIWMLMHNHFGHTRFAVVGHDWGAPVAFRLAADHPAEVTHLAMLDVPVPGDQPAGAAIGGGAAMVAPVPSGARSSRSAGLWPRTALSRILLHERMRSGRRDRRRRHRGIRAHLLAAGRDARGLQLLPRAHAKTSPTIAPPLRPASNSRCQRWDSAAEARAAAATS